MKRYLFCNIAAMMIFGTIALFVRQIALSSAMIAFLRTCIGTLVLGLVLLVKHIRIHVEQGEWKYLLLSACFLGCNWVFLFMGYAYTTISNATIIYYCAPLMIIVLTCLFWHQHIKRRMVACLMLAMLGLVLITFDAADFEWRGMICSFLAACCYASLVVINRRIHMEPLSFTFMQLLIASLILLPYVCITKDIMQLSDLSILLNPWLFSIGVVHTGMAYLLYFTSIAKLPADKIALYAYLDPCTAILLSSFVLHEQTTMMQWMGIICIVVGLLFSQKGSEATCSTDLKMD